MGSMMGRSPQRRRTGSARRHQDAIKIRARFIDETETVIGHPPLGRERPRAGRIDAWTWQHG
jgi:hypothetical protein